MNRSDVIGVEYHMTFFGEYPSHASSIYEATLLFEYDEDAGHPETTLRGFWKREEEVK